MEFFQAEKNAKLFAGMIYSGCRMAAWGFGNDKRLFYTTSPHEQTYLTFF